MIPQTIFSFKLETTKEKSTAHGVIDFPNKNWSWFFKELF